MNNSKAILDKSNIRQPIVVYGLTMKDGTEPKKPQPIAVFESFKQAMDSVRQARRYKGADVGYVFRKNTIFHAWKVVQVSPPTH